jgi:hypothetical protein
MAGAAFRRVQKVGQQIIHHRIDRRRRVELIRRQRPIDSKSGTNDLLFALSRTTEKPRQLPPNRLGQVS